jgi:UDP-N-acetylmuramate dehydrogenase
MIHYPFPVPNSFQIEIFASHFAEIKSENDLNEDYIQQWEKPFTIIGGGSNCLFAGNYTGTLVQNSIRGIQVVSQTEDDLLIDVGAGENWHDWVMYSVQNNWGGIENLALIPGSVGASPMQNIGAYGVEVQDVIDSVRYFHIPSGTFKTINNIDCQFGYRMSIFKTELKDQVIITQVRFRLTRRNHQLHLEYGAIQEQLKQRNITNPTLKDIATVVVDIRESKLPNPQHIGNAGSFFKNPVIKFDEALRLKDQFPEVSIFPIDDHSQKVSAASLIEGCGWKGKIVGNTGTYKYHSLVLVNHGGATGAEIMRLASDIQQSVYSKYGIKIEAEVNFIGSTN